jgi:hypothetical protein
MALNRSMLSLLLLAYWGKHMRQVAGIDSPQTIPVVRSNIRPTFSQQVSGRTPMAQHVLRAVYREPIWSWLVGRTARKLRFPISFGRISNKSRVKPSLIAARKKAGQCIPGIGAGSFYLKVILSKTGQQACVLELKYPPANKLELDAIVSRVAKSLRLPQSGIATR